MNALSGKFITLSGKAEASTDSRFGPVPVAPMLYARLCDEGCDQRLAFVLAHPSGNFLNHYLLERLQQRGAASLAINTRYVGNDTNLFMERAIQDVGAGVSFLRQQGYKRIVLIGNSGGGSLAAFYQAEAEKLSVSALPDGTPFDLSPTDIPAADGVALLAAHPSRASVLTDWLDPSIADEGDLWSMGDSSLDMFAPENGPPYSGEWLSRYRQAQQSRNDKITDLVEARLKVLAERQGKGAPVVDLPLIVHRTGADPRFLDLSIDPDDRRVQDAKSAKASNYSHASMARISSLRSWLSQWSARSSRADGPRSLAKTTVPVFVVRYSADGIVYPSQIAQWLDASKGRASAHVLKGATHFLRGQAELQNDLANNLLDWARALS